MTADDRVSKARAEMLAILMEQEKIQAEYERMAREERLRFYRPLPKQAEAHLCGKRSVWVMGGNRSGKP